MVRTNNFDEIGQFNDKMEASAKEQDIPIKSIVNGILNLARLNVLDDDKNERLSLVLVSQVIKTTFLETDHIYM